MSISNKNIIQSWSIISQDEMERFGAEGDFSRQHILNPTLLKLLAEVSGKSILDAGCGTGYFSRMLASKGARVTGVEPADSMFNYAVSKEKEDPLGITYLQDDLSKFYTNEEYDVVVSNMVFMDIPDYENAMKNCINTLKPNGLFIFSISHPCFEDIGDEWGDSQRIVVKEYLNAYEIKRNYGYSFHRPLSAYTNIVIKGGCEIIAIIEPQLAESIAEGNPKALRDVHVPSFVIIHAIRK